MKLGLPIFLALSFAAVPAHAADTIRIALNADIRSTDPGVNRDDNTDGVVLNVVEGLTGHREDGSAAPLLAESIDLSEDGLTYTFRLRSGVKFHNGEDLTSEDVLWSWNRYMDPATQWRCLETFNGTTGLKVESVTAPDPSTVVMTINRPYALFPDALAATDCGGTAIVHRDSVNADGTWDKPIGTGPFQFTEWRRGEYVLLTKFDDYQSPPGDAVDGYVGSKRPLVDEVRFVVVPDAAAVKTALLSGTIDASQVLDSDVEELKQIDKIVVQSGSAASKHTIIMQTLNPVLSNVLIRQAIVSAIDGDELAFATSNGLATPNNSAIFPTSFYYSDVQRERYKYDPDRARALLQEAGYNGEEIVIMANMRVHVPSYPAALFVQQMLQQVGMNVRIEVVEWPTQLDAYNSGRFQMMSTSYSARLDPAMSYEQITGPKATQPRKVWDNPEATALIDKAMVESDPAARQAIFDRLHRMQLEDAPLYIMYSGVESNAYSKRIDGFSYWQGKPRAWEVRIANP
ncbi:ABC transporter substrate-binding protein [Pseudochelatococcus sp. B33]